MSPGHQRLVSVVFVTLFFDVAESRTWYIRPDGTGDAPTIQAGLDSALTGDQVILAEGRYTWSSQGATGESMIRMKRDVTLASERGRGTTVIDAERRGRGILCVDVGDAVIRALRIIEGKVSAGDPRGAGILSTGDSRLTLSDCTIAYCFLGIVDSAKGGGIYIDGGQLEHSTISFNRVEGAGASGGGVFCVNTTVTDCSILGNWCLGGSSPSSGAGIMASGSVITDCFIDGNESREGNPESAGGGVHLRGGLLERSWVSLNRSSKGTGLFCSDAEIRNCVFIRNTTLPPQKASSSVTGGTIASAAADLPSEIVGCSVVGNAVSNESADVGGIALLSGGEISNTIVSHNQGSACSGPVAIRCSLFFANSGGNDLCGMDLGDNLAMDPMFCVPDPVATQNVDIRSDSPCARGNHPGGASCGLIGARDVACITDVQMRTWSQIKTLFR